MTDQQNPSVSTPPSAAQPPVAKRVPTPVPTTATR